MIRFGTDGVRGPAGVAPITEEGAAAIGRAAARWAREAGGDAVVVGRDTRPSGAALEGAVAAAVAGEGLRARVAGVLPTSGVAAAIAAGAGAVGVVVTASHNPASDNGFKVLGSGGHKPGDAAIARIEAWLEAPAEPAAGGVVEVCPDAMRGLYTAALDAALSEARATLGGCRVALDLARGAASAVTRWLEALPCEVVVRGADRGPINDGCGALHPEALARTVVEEGCTAGIAVDGDGDRCVLVDERGVVVDGDALAYWLAKATGADVIAVTVMSNAALEAALPGVTVLRTAVGDRHLTEAIRDRGARLGVESSGHALFADGLPGGDGLLTGLRAVALAARAGVSISEAVSGYRPYPSRLARVAVSSRPPLASIDPLERARRDGEAALGPGGRVFLRYSGTEPLLRVLVEGRDAEAVERVTEAVVATARGVWP